MGRGIITNACSTLYGTLTVVLFHVQLIGLITLGASAAILLALLWMLLHVLLLPVILLHDWLTAKSH